MPQAVTDLEHSPAMSRLQAGAVGWVLAAASLSRGPAVPDPRPGAVVAVARRERGLPPRAALTAALAAAGQAGGAGRWRVVRCVGLSRTFCSPTV